MSARRKPRPKHRQRAGGGARPNAQRGTQIKLRQVPDGSWELVHPRCARERAEDLEEVEQMIAGGETEIATDELRWLLEGCSDFIAAHALLGEMALAEGDHRLARGHFGYAYTIVTRALPPKFKATLPYRAEANQVFFSAAKGLAWCLWQLGRRRMAIDVVETMLRLDPSDPLKVAPWRSEWRAAPPLTKDQKAAVDEEDGEDD